MGGTRQQIAHKGYKSSRDQRDKAKFLYMSGFSLADIVEMSEVNHDELHYLVYGVDGKGIQANTWFRQREDGGVSTVKFFLKQKMEVLESTSGMALDLIVTGLKKIKQQVDDGTKTLSVKEVKTLTEVFGDFHKVMQLEQGKPTEIFKAKGLSAQEARQILESDPFALGIVDISGKGESVDLLEFDPLDEEVNE